MSAEAQILAQQLATKNFIDNFGNLIDSILETPDMIEELKKIIIKKYILALQKIKKQKYDSLDEEYQTKLNNLLDEYSPPLSEGGKKKSKKSKKFKKSKKRKSRKFRR